MVTTMLTDCSKVRWKSRRTAKKAARWQRRINHEPAAIWGVYLCESCGLWHIGHRRPRGMAVAA